MHKSFYASGFLFHPPTQQILLQQSYSSDEVSLFSGKGEGTESINDAFRRIIHERLKVDIPDSQIYHIYSYDHQTTGKVHHVFYAILGADSEEAPSFQKMNAKWCSFKMLYKSKLNKDLLQDLVVGQRVINASLRVNL